MRRRKPGHARVKSGMPLRRFSGLSSGSTLLSGSTDSERIDIRAVRKQFLWRNWNEVPVVSGNVNMGRTCAEKDERGAVTIVEATFVFPIMFFIVFFMLMLGSVLFQQARVERLAESAALEAAARCENPILEQLDNGKLPTSSNDNHIKPYRYIFSSYAKGICTDVESELRKKINSFGSMGFSGMSAHVDNVSIDPHLYLLVSNIDLVCNFHVNFPIRMIFSNDNIVFRYRVVIRQPISDPTELVRNISTVQDLGERSEAVTNFMSKFQEVLGKVAKYIN